MIARRPDLVLRAAPIALATALCLKLIYFARALECCGPFPGNRAMFSATFAGVFLLFSPAPLLRPRVRLAFAIVANCAVTTLALADSIHYQFFGDLISVTELDELVQVPFVMSSVVTHTHVSDLMYYADVLSVLAAAVFTGRYRFPFASAVSARAVRFASITFLVGVTLTARTNASRRFGG